MGICRIIFSVRDYISVCSDTGAPSGYPLPDDNRMSPPLDAQKVLALGLFVTSLTTLIGFVVTTVVTWRKEQRESNHASIAIENDKPELEKLRREITDRNAAAQEKRKKTSKRRRVV